MSATIATDSPFNEEEAALLRTLALLIIPPSADYDLPGAHDEAIFADLLNEAANNEEGIRPAVAAAMEAGLQPVNFSVAFDPITTAAAALERVQQLEGTPALAPLVSVIMQCYYRDDRVMRSIGMEARPPFPLGYELEEGDWSMLEPVQRRGKIWRDA